MHRPGAALLCAALLLAGPAPAADVTLTARGGGLTVSGELLGYDGAFWRIGTEHGELTLDAAGVTCAGACPDPATFVPAARISATPDALRVLLPALVAAFADRNGLTAAREDLDGGGFAYDLVSARGAELRLRFRPTGSDEALADLIANEADLAITRRPATADEIALGRDAGIGALDDPIQSQVLALDAEVAAVARANPLRRLPVADLRAVLAGENADRAPSGADTGPMQLRVAARPDPLVLLAPATETPPAPDAGALVQAVAGDPAALAVLRWSELDGLRPLVLTGSCGFRAAPSPASIKTGDYPFTTPLFLYRPARRLPPILHRFLDFLLSPAAQPVIRRAGFVDQGIAERPIDLQGRRLAQAIAGAGGDTSFSLLQHLVGHLAQGVRLTPTFRFDGGSSGLTAASRSTAILLAQALQSHVHDGSRIELIGFSDGRGDAAANALLAKARADAVLAALHRLAPDLDPAAITFATSSYGEALPILCDEDPWGAEVNRRVEVWRFPVPPPRPAPP